MAFTLVGQSGASYEFTRSGPMNHAPPAIAGVYAYYRGGGAVAYIGQTNDLNRRHSEHLGGSSSTDLCIRGNADNIGYYFEDNDLMRRTHESDLIAGVRPLCQG